MNDSQPTERATPKTSFGLSRRKGKAVAPEMRTIGLTDVVTKTTIASTISSCALQTKRCPFCGQAKASENLTITIPHVVNDVDVNSDRPHPLKLSFRACSACADPVRSDAKHYHRRHRFLTWGRFVIMCLAMMAMLGVMIIGGDTVKLFAPLILLIPAAAVLSMTLSLSKSSHADQYLPVVPLRITGSTVFLEVTPTTYEVVFEECDNVIDGHQEVDNLIDALAVPTKYKE